MATLRAGSLRYRVTRAVNNIATFPRGCNAPAKLKYLSEIIFILSPDSRVDFLISLSTVLVPARVLSVSTELSRGPATDFHFRSGFVTFCADSARENRSSPPFFIPLLSLLSPSLSWFQSVWRSASLTVVALAYGDDGVSVRRQRDKTRGGETYVIRSRHRSSIPTSSYSFLSARSGRVLQICWYPPWKTPQRSSGQ